MATSALSTVTLAERPDLTAPLRESGLDGALSWPKFYEGCAAKTRFWERTYTDFAAYQTVFVDGVDVVVACGHTAPLFWDGTVDGLPSGWDAGIERACVAEQEPNTLMALAAVAHPVVKNAGLGAEILKAMRELGRKHGFSSLIAAVRPVRKESYPLASFEEYIGWCLADGSAFDPWLRTHLNLGGKVIQVAPESMVVEGTVEQWTIWTGGRFPASGAYVVPGALAPVHIDVEKDLGRYAEPNVWVLHRLDTGSQPE